MSSSQVRISVIRYLVVSTSVAIGVIVCRLMWVSLNERSRMGIDKLTYEPRRTVPNTCHHLHERRI